MQLLKWQVDVRPNALKGDVYSSIALSIVMNDCGTPNMASQEDLYYLSLNLKYTHVDLLLKTYPQASNEPHHMESF